MKSRDLKKLPADDLERLIESLGGYKPKGHPFPLFINDLKDDTIGWDGSDRYRYIVLLDHIFHRGGYIPDDLGYIADVSGINRARNWREKAEKLRCILVKSKMKEGFLTQKKVMCEVISASNRSKIASLGGHAKASKNGADSTTEGLPHSSTYTYPKGNIDSNNNDSVDLNRGHDGRLLLRSKTLDDVKDEYPGWSVQAMVDAFEGLNEGKCIKYPDKAFRAFVKIHMNGKGQ